MKEDPISPAVKAALRQLFEEEMAFDKILGLSIASFNPERPLLRFDMRPELLGNPLRRVLHGGVIAAALDTVAGLGLMLAIVRAHAGDPPQEQLARLGQMGTIDLRIDYLRPGRGAHFIASAQVLRLGAKVASVRMELENDAGELIAAGSAAYVVG